MPGYISALASIVCPYGAVVFGIAVVVPATMYNYLMLECWTWCFARVERLAAGVHFLSHRRDAWSTSAC